MKTSPKPVILAEGLQESGYSVDLARNGLDGLHMAREAVYDLIVLDVMMPGLDGWQVLGRLRQDRDTPVLFLTARDELADRIRGLDMGADDYLVKPFSLPSYWRVSAPCCGAALCAGRKNAAGRLAD